MRNGARRHRHFLTCAIIIRRVGSADGLKIVLEQDFLKVFFPESPAGVLYTPQPPDPKYAWARQYGHTEGFTLCGVTHTLCSPGAIYWLNSLITAPFEEYDALICTSTAVTHMVTKVSEAYCDFLRDRFGGNPRLKPRLELIPLGVNTEKFFPALPDGQALSKGARNRRRRSCNSFYGAFSTACEGTPISDFFGSSTGNPTGFTTNPLDHLRMAQTPELETRIYRAL